MNNNKSLFLSILSSLTPQERYTWPMSTQDHQHNIETFKNSTASVVRTLSGQKDLEIVFSAAEAPIGQITSMTRPRLPIPDYQMDARTMRLVRGCGDAHALRIAHHDNMFHVEHIPKNPQAAAAFEALEQARCEALGMNAMDGTAHNLSEVLEEKCRRRGYTNVHERGQVNLPDALHMFSRMVMSEEKPPPSAQKAMALWQPWFEEHFEGADLDALTDSMADQRAFATQARKFIQALGMDVGGLDDAAKDNADSCEDSQEDAGAQDRDSSEDTDSQDSSAGSPDMDEDAEWDKDAEFDSGYDDIMENLDSDSEGEDSAPASSAPRDTSIHGAQGLYQIYTTAFDEEIKAQDLAEPEELSRLRKMLDQQLVTHQTIITKLANRLQRKLMAQQTRKWQFDLEEGIIDPARLARVIANPDVPLSFKREQEMPFKDTVVSILIDNSGSMRGRPIAIAAMCGDILSRTLERCGVKVEVLGFTTRAWKGGKARALWMESGRPDFPGRLNDLRHIIYKEADAPMRRTRKNMGLMLKEGLLKENIDGEALAWAYNRLARRREARKILMVISDGAPVDDSTLSANPSQILEDDLRTVIGWIEERSDIDLSAIGIGHDVTRYYQKALTIKDADELANALTEQLAGLFDDV